MIVERVGLFLNSTSYHSQSTWLTFNPTQTDRVERDAYYRPLLALSVPIKPSPINPDHSPSRENICQSL